MFDFDRAQRIALAEAFARVGLTQPADALWTFRKINDELWEGFRRGKIAGRGLAVERFRRLLRHVGADARGAPVLGRMFLERLTRRGDVLPACRRTLRQLSRRYRLGLVTNGYDRVQRGRLAAAGLAGFFEVVVTSEGCGFAKPDPRILGVALDALGVRPVRAWYVGDDLRTDGGAARDAGVPFCWMDHGHGVPAGWRAPRRRVRALPELLRLL